jgi:ribonuclease PH
LVSRQERRLERLLRQALAPSVPLSQYHKCAVLVQVTIVDPGENHGILFSNGSGSSSSITVAGDALLPACVLASSLALADANVELYDTVTCGRVAVVVEEYLQEEEGVRATSSRRPLVLVDPTTEEEDGASAVLTIAMMTGWKEVTYWKQCGNLTTAATTTAGMDVLNHAMELCAEQCRVLRKFVARHLHGHATVPASAVATADPRRHQP